MALAELPIKIIGRSQGHSVVAAAAYRSGERLHDKRYSQTHDYTPRAQSITFKEILAPEGAPAWVFSRETLWNTVEAAENRKDAQLAREVIAILPRELSREQHVTLLREFVQTEFVSQGMIADVCLHYDERLESGSVHNPHAHILLSLRRLDGEKFADTKAVEWNPAFFKEKGDRDGMVLDKAPIKTLRQRWEQAVNTALSDANSAARVDLRSYAQRGLKRVPEPKLGKAHHMRHPQHSEQQAKQKLVERTRWMNGLRGMVQNAYQKPPDLFDERAQQEYEASQFYQTWRETPAFEPDYTPAPAHEVYQGRLYEPPELER